MIQVVVELLGKDKIFLIFALTKIKNIHRLFYDDRKKSKRGGA